MKTATALASKFALTFIFAVIAFMFINDNPVGWVFLVALTGTALNYVAGDLFVLPKYGNTAASIGDGVMGAAVAYIFDVLTPEFGTNAFSLISFAVLIALGEYFFHQYLLKTEKVAP